MRRRDPFGEALGTIRERIRLGVIAPGAPLLVEDLAKDLHLSPTPIREALAHLAGRGVIEGRRAGGRGYAAWPMTASELADLYRFQDLLAVFALEAPTAVATLGAAEPPPGSFAERTERLFHRLARGRGNAPLLHIQAGLADRLHLARLAEPQVLPDAMAELAALEAHDLASLGLRDVVTAYSARRISGAEHIARAATLLAEDGVKSSAEATEI